MKSFKSITIVSATVLLLAACTGDLDPKSLGPKAVTAASVYKTPADYLSGLAKLYASFALSGQQGPAGDSDISGLDEGFGVYLRELWNVQELTTDEAVIAWNDQTVKNFHWQNWASNDVFIAAMYARVMLTVSYCNEFIRASSASSDAQVKQYHAEARFIRALAYWHALDMFGNPPFVTEKDEPGAFNPKQTNPADLFAYIDSELQAIENELPAPTGTPGDATYGHANRAALYMLQAKLYLNAQTYISADKYTECITALNKLFAFNAYTLPANYLLNFAANNMTSPELIFTINYDGAHSQSYGGMDYIIHAAIGGSMSPGNYGVAGGWGGTRATSAFVGKFPDPSGATDARAQFYTSGQNLQIVDIAQFTDGYAIKKFSNRTIPDGPSASGVPDFVDTDFPMFRLADANLMLAEAFVRGGSGTDAATATQKLNDVIRRGHNASAAYDHATLSVGSASDLSDLLDERARELYWEGHRRTDLIRFGQFTDGSYLWPWKGNVETGATVPSYRNLFPIPSSELIANPTLKQNTGY
ncbi:MAG: RagB/SusD family nutrient uptake outer membrane protein [Bacteroidetes bacterium]|nr:RagB/SusD family nutrient uptake outer membrane protein [Bacteroidota bacterium]